jgi:hypothetical protein
LVSKNPGPPGFFRFRHIVGFCGDFLLANLCSIFLMVACRRYFRAARLEAFAGSIDILCAAKGLDRTNAA